MSRPVPSPGKFSINRDHAIDQDTLNKLKNFKNGLGRNYRVLVNRSGNTTIYTRHRESVSEKFSRKLGNFGTGVKAAWSHVSDLFPVKNQGNEPETMKNVKDTPTQKSPGSISVKQFNLEIAPITNICIIPVLDNLTYQTSPGLNDLRSMIDEIQPIDRALDLLATGPQDLKKIRQEFAAFLDFAENQAQGKPVTHQNRGAIEFANRWANISTPEYRELKKAFGESYPLISKAAIALATFDRTSLLDNS